MQLRPTRVSTRRVALVVLVALPLAACNAGADDIGAPPDVAAATSTSSPAVSAGGIADPHSLGPVNNLSEARARWNPSKDPSMVITDNGDGTYTIVRTDR